MQFAGIEAAIHVANDLFNENVDNPNYGFLLVDTNNAFNSINCKHLLCTIRYLWPGASRHFFNTCKRFSLLFIHGSSCVIFSEEGATQGDAMAMLTHSITLIPLTRDLKALLTSNHAHDI